MSKNRLLNIGFGNFLVQARVIGIVSPASSPMRRLREDARAAGRLIDATQGRKTRSIIITDSNHVVLSAIQAETVGARFRGQAGPEAKEELESISLEPEESDGQ